MSKKPIEFYFNDGSDVKDELEKEAKKDLEKVVKELEDKKKLAERYTLDEAPIPRDLSKAYRGRSNYKNEVNRNNIDLQHADYTEITPEEAVQIIRKGDPSTLRLIIEGNLVLIDGKYGSQDDRYRIKYTDYDHWYYTKSGNAVKDTARFPVSHLVSIADKIYKTNEDQVHKDPALMSQRKENHHSNYDNADLFSKSSERRGKNPVDDWEINSARRSYDRALRKYEKSIDDYNAAENDSDKTRLKAAMEDNEYWFNRYRTEYKNLLNRLKDYDARARYYDSEADLTQNVRKFKELKPELARNERRAQSYQSELNDFDANGDPEILRIKDDITWKKNRLAKAIQELTNLEYELEGAEFKSAENRQKLVDKVNDQLVNVDKIRQEIDSLLRKNNNFSESKKLFAEAEDAGKVDDLIETIESLYCNKKTTSAMLEQLEMSIDEVKSILEL